MSSHSSAVRLDLSSEAWDATSPKLPRGMLQFRHKTTARHGAGLRHLTVKSRPLFPEFGSPQDATLLFPLLFSNRGMPMSIDGRDWWVTYNPQDRWLLLTPAPGVPLPVLPVLRRRRWPEDLGRLELEGPQPALVLFGQPRQREQRVFAEKGHAARNLFTLCSPQYTENVLVVTDGWGKPYAGFLDRNNL